MKIQQREEVALRRLIGAILQDDHDQFEAAYHSFSEIDGIHAHDLLRTLATYAVVRHYGGTLPSNDQIEALGEAVVSDADNWLPEFADSTPLKYLLLCMTGRQRELEHPLPKIRAQAVFVLLSLLLSYLLGCQPVDDWNDALDSLEDEVEKAQ